ncbi:hypothetical protein HKCCE2091_19190 [Rhodobacterales bacterium HKCCE2091]|nr:hypothetical protein [Rhodobacterales bacterium HKCCE2091]
MNAKIQHVWAWKSMYYGRGRQAVPAVAHSDKWADLSTDDELRVRSESRSMTHRMPDHLKPEYLYLPEIHPEHRQPRRDFDGMHGGSL